MIDDRMDELIRDAARGYNVPSDTPRDSMWERVRTTRTRVSRRRARAVWAPPGGTAVWSTAGIAAVLLVGIAIGRVVERTSSDRTASEKRAVGTAPRLTDTMRAAPPASVAVAPDSGVAAPAPVVTPMKSGVRRIRRATPQPAQALALANARGPAAAPENRGDQGTDLTNRLVLLQHLAGTEAMLTSFRTSARTRGGQVDAQLTSWARDLLTTTRMLEASSLSADPKMKRLLEDLELVLVQIAQYTANSPHRSEELDLIEQAIDRRGVIMNLRTIPTGITSSGT